MATILIVDDLAANRNHLFAILGVEGHQLLEAGDGREALAIAQAQHPDLVITDVLMPATDGYALVNQLRLDPSTSGIPVVVSATSGDHREARALALASGVSDVLQKPADPQEVLKIVARVLAGATEIKKPPAAPLVSTLDRDHLRLLSSVNPEDTVDLKAANARLRTLINIGLELSSERDVLRVLHRVCQAARDLFGATYVTLGIVTPDGLTVEQCLTCGADGTVGVTAAPWLLTGDALSGLLHRVVAERRTVRGKNPCGDPALLELPADHPEVYAFLAAPIVSPTEVHGWMCLVGNEGKSFAEEEEHLLMALAGQVGRMFENLTLSALAHHRAEQLAHQIRQREQADVALNESEARYRALVDWSPESIVVSRGGILLFLNPAAVTMMGAASAQDLVGTAVLDRMHPESQPLMRERLASLAERGGVLPLVEYRVLRLDGTFIDVETQGMSILYDGALALYSSMREITGRKQAERALRTSEERIRFALDAAQVGIWDMDFTTGVLQWSAILEAQHGLQPGTFGGTFEAFVECVHPEDRQALVTTMSAHRQSGASFSIQYRTLWPDGTVRWLSGAGRIDLGRDGEPLRGVGIFLDVTERHALEAQYQQAQKMRAIGQLAGGVAHDFNNLLGVILGYSELILTERNPNDSCRGDIGEIQKAAVSAARLTRQLLAFSRKEVTQPMLLNLNVTVRDISDMLRRLIGEDVTVVLALEPVLAPVTADRGQVEQIVMNLAVNARDAMPNGGTLTIHTANVKFDEQSAQTHKGVTPGSYVTLTVTDTGTGMTPEVQDHLFEPFFTTKGPGKGTGLGLVTVHGIVMRSGGSIVVDSVVGRGTSIIVFLPRADATETTGTPAPPVPRASAGMHTVLVVDDAKEFRELTKRLLERQGYTVHTAADAGEATQLFDDHSSIDLLLTDVVMPGPSGPALVKELVARRPTLKVVYMSGYTDETIGDHGILDPGIAFVHKPFSSETLGRKIREELER